jgi:endonuclease/exonuclease/phosphatase family metal-dependent hydrolase
LICKRTSAISANFPRSAEIELGGAGTITATAPTDRFRVAVWNVERLRHIEAIGSLLARHQPDVILLSEVDKGMARSGNRHCLAELAGRLGHSFAYGVEFIELDLGDQNEILTSPGEQNLLGFHGNALTSALRLHRPFVVRLEADGGWFGPARGQQRVGGRMAIGAQIEIGGVWVTFVSVHLESNSSPIQRKAQVSHLLDVVERYDGDAPLLIGGDFNTSTVDRRQDRDVEFRRTEFATDPMRLLDVEAHEPLFRELADRGFDWSASNVPGRPTERPQRASRCDPLAKSTGSLHAACGRSLLKSFPRSTRMARTFPTTIVSSSRWNRLAERADVTPPLAVSGSMLE